MTSFDYAELLESAWTAYDCAYAPYSNFHVGAALAIRHEDKILFVNGCNVENATYGATVCAERTAIQKAVSEGILPSGKLLAVAVATKPAKPNFTPPCGICRQVLQEFASEPDQVPVLMSIVPGEIGREFTLGDLLPFPFDKNNL